ncbi:unnamed protein product [Blepharisma stoltei]|uniref:Lipid-binding serum glycoprotein C-terminal domain-containing protein n=1 Tax=Blepharisma stoltei TaxID=1481888 RepID=A0AAU9IV83_9CILI|nr:unnamed protein product [Blepharisma stoltei]
MKFFLLALLPALIFAGDNALSLSINQAPLHEIVQILLAFGEGYSINYTLGNFTFNFNAGFKGELELMNVQLQGVTANLTTSGLTFKEPDEIQLAINDGKIVVTFNYLLKYGLTYKGTGTLTILGLDFDYFITVIQTQPKDKAQILIRHLAAVITNIELTTTGLSSTIKKLLLEAMISEIPTLEKTIEGYVANKTDDINMLLYILPYELELESLRSIIDLHLTQNTSVSNGYLSIPFLGEVYNSTTKSSFIPFKAIDLPAYGADGLDFQIFLSDYFLNSLVVAYWGLLNIDLKQLPPTIPLKLTTDGLAFLIPNLKQTYGKGKNVALTFNSDPAYQYPTVWTNNSLNFNATLQTKFAVQTSSTAWTNALDLLTSIYINANLHLNGTVLNFDINTLDLWQVSVINSNVGTVNTAVLSMLLENLFDILVPIINNDLGKVNISLPKIKYIEFTDDILVLNNGYSEIAANIAPSII